MQAEEIMMRIGRTKPKGLPGGLARRRALWVLSCLLLCAAGLPSCGAGGGTPAPTQPRPLPTQVSQEATPTPEPGPSVERSLLLRQGIGRNPTGLWLDETHHRLYVQCTDELNVVDTTTGSVARAAIPRGARILALDAEGERLLLGGSGGSGPGALLVVNGETGEIVRQVTLPAIPWRTLFLPEQNLAVVALTPGGIAAVDVESGQKALLDAGGVRPLMAADPEAGKVYISGARSEGGNRVEEAISVLDVRSGHVEVVSLPAAPTAMAVHIGSHRLFILHQYQGGLTTYTPGEGMQEMLSLGGELTEVVVDQSQNRAYIVDWQGNRVLVMNAWSVSVEGIVETIPAAHLLAPWVESRRLYLGRADLAQLTVLEQPEASTVALSGPPGTVAAHPVIGVTYVTIPSEQAVVALAPGGEEFLRWSLPARPEGMVLDAAQGRLFVSLPAINALAIIDLATRAQDIISHAFVPSHAVLNPADGLLYVADAQGNELYVFSAGRGQLMRTVAVGTRPATLALNAATGEVLAACADGLWAVAPGAQQGQRVLRTEATPLLAVSTGLNRIFVGLTGTSPAVQVLDGGTHNLLRRLDGAGRLLHLDADAQTGHALAVWQPAGAMGLTVWLLDGQTLEVQQVAVPVTIPTGAHSVAHWDRERGKLCLAYGNGSIRVVLIEVETGEAQSVAQFAAPADVPSAIAPFSLQCDPVLGKVYLGRYDSEQLLIVDSQSALSTTVTLDAGVVALAVDSLRARVYASLTDGTLTIVDGRATEVAGGVSLGGAANLLLADSEHQRVFAAEPMAAVVHVVSDPILEPEPGPLPTPAPSPTTQAPISPWTTFANADKPRLLVFDGQYLWTGTEMGGIVRWNPKDGSFRQFLAPQDGLRSNQIHSLVARGPGDVWAATGRGLSHYDVWRWITHSLEDWNVEGSAVRSAAVDSSGRVWAGAQEGSVILMDGAGRITYDAERLALAGSWATEIATDAEGRTWLGSWQGVSLLDASGVVTYTAQNSNLPPGVVSALLALPDGSVWAGTDSGMAVFQQGDWAAFAPESGAPDHVWALAATADGAVWAANDLGIHRYDGQAWQTVGSVQAAAEIYMADWATVTARTQRWPIAFAADKVWALLQSGLADFDGQLWTRRSTTGAAPPSNQARALAIGADGTLWAGFTGSGVARFDGQRWETFSAPNQVGLNVNAILTDTEGRVWVAADAGVSQYDGERWTFYKAGEAGSLGGRALALAWNPAGTLWVGTEQGIHSWRRDTWTAYTTTNSGLTNDRALALAVDADGNLWGATSGGVAFYDGEAWQMFTDPAVPATEQEIGAVALGGQELRWFAARRAVRRLSGANWFNYKDLREAVGYDYKAILNTSNNPNGLWAVDSVGQKVWIIVEGGVAAYDGSVWETYTPDNSGLVSGRVSAILVDNSGAVWFATDKGISRLSP